MINSPSLSVVSTTPKVAKTSSSSQGNAGSDFGSVLDATNRPYSADRTSKSSSVASDKNQQIQSSTDSSVTVDGTQKTGEAEPHSVQSKPQDKEAKEIEQPVKTDGGESVDQDKVGADSSELSPVDKDGKERQTDGQAVAVDGSVMGDSTQSSRLDTASGVIQPSPQTSDEQLSQEDSADQNSVDEMNVSSEGEGTSTLPKEYDTSTEIKNTQLSEDSSESEGGKTSQLDTGSSNVEDGENTLSNPINQANDNAHSSNDVQKKVSEENQLELDGSVASSNSGVISDATFQEGLPSEVATETTAAVADDVIHLQGKTQTGSESVLQSDHTAPLDAEVVAINQSEAANENIAPLNVSASSSENLRWMMEQLSKKAEQATSGLNTAPNAMNVSKSALSGESLAAALQDGDLSVLMDKDLIELPKDLSELMGAKKALEQAVTGFSSPLQPTGQGLNSLTSANALMGAATANARPEGAAAQLTMHASPDTQAWSSEMTSKVSWVVKEGFKTAHIQLDPPELGSLTVKVSIDQDSNTHVSFIASSAHAKEALEGQMQRLRDMLQQQGMDLDSVDVEVSQDNGQAYGSDASDGQNGQGKGGGNLGNDDVGDMDGLENVSYVSPAEQGIDYYA
ncbi:flagellar hook-length control protein FliK [Marinomonas gallaica]|uniref:flagellar hook-length control protein FliK n=1 Tax=Marinomonas gallaica TaxID=1806667 RepID=UPI0008336647|nr:flagellar hook-length control protein FliK [Marinomonas gallaica]